MKNVTGTDRFSLDDQVAVEVIRSARFVKLPTDHPAYALIGRVAAEWAEFEHTLDQIIWGLAYLDGETGACITAQVIGARPRFELILSLAQRISVPDKVLKTIETQKNVAIATNHERNRIVHDAWWHATEGDEIAQFMSPRYKDERFGLYAINKHDVEKTIESIRDKISKARQLRKTLLVHMISLHEKSE
jgi:hypothetical protein